MSAPDLYWHCLQCGAHDPVEPTGGPESYALGDWEKCIDCGDGQARVVTLRLGAAYEQARALGMGVSDAWERAKSLVRAQGLAGHAVVEEGTGAVVAGEERGGDHS